MSKAHDLGVTENRLHLENTLDDGYWDDVFTEHSYYLNQSVPYNRPPAGERGREVGEFDYLAVNYEDKVFLYGEVKSSYSDLEHAYEQLERADEFFEDWEMVGQTFVRDNVFKV